MTNDLDSLLQDSADAIATRDLEYITAYTRYLDAVRSASQALIRMNRTKLPTTRKKAEAKYLIAMESWLESRHQLDNAQIERINVQATYAQIVRLLGEELTPRVNDIAGRVARIEAQLQADSQP